MLSRVAECLFWLGRYTERAENYARFIAVNFNLSLDLPPGVQAQWDPLVTASGDREHFISLFGEEFSQEHAILFLAFDERNQNSITSAVSKARENARIVRDSIPKETWEVLNELHFFIAKLKKRKIWQRDDASSYFIQIRNSLQLLNGISYDTIPRNQAWYFTKVGQFLERADKTSRILDVKYHVLLPSVDEVGSPLDFLHWTALLKSVSGFNAYRKYFGKINALNIIEFLVLNRFFPRSMFYCLLEAEQCLRKISENPFGYSNPAEKAIGNLRAQLEFADINDVFEFGLHEYLDQFQIKLNEISTAITDQYFKIKPNFDPPVQHQS